MNSSDITPERISPNGNHAEAHPRHNGLIVFCEKKLRYEKGIRAWIFLAPYFLGAVALERVINAEHAKAEPTLGTWIGFLAYLIFFPSVWKYVWNFIALRKTDPIAPTASSAVQQR